jgi:hypothetical protein
MLMETYIWGKLNTSTILKAGKIIGGEHAKDRAKEALRRIALAIEDPKSGENGKLDEVLLVLLHAEKHGGDIFRGLHVGKGT